MNSKLPIKPAPDYSAVPSDISQLLEQARRSAAQAVNKTMTAAYWEIWHTASAKFNVRTKISIFHNSQGGEKTSAINIPPLQNNSGSLCPCILKMTEIEQEIVIGGRVSGCR